MTNQVNLKCKCGATEGIAKDISPQTGNNIVCMCIDCQTFAHYLKRENDVLDKFGGSHIFQVTPNKIEITKGKENLACLMLSPKGAKRWFAKCCNTPVANTASLKFSFNGVLQTFFDFDSHKMSKEDLIGPLEYSCMAKYAKGTPPSNCHDKFPPTLVFKIMRTMLLGKFTKSYLPNSFFDEKTGAPLVEPIILSKSERDEIRNRINGK